MAIVRKYDSDPTPTVLSARNAQTDTVDTPLIDAQGSQQLMIDAISVVNSSVTGTYVDILSNGVVIWTIAAPASGAQSNVSFPRPLPATRGQNISAKVAAGVSTCYISVLAHLLQGIVPNTQ